MGHEILADRALGDGASAHDAAVLGEVLGH
jgi:hypothetical protein